MGGGSSTRQNRGAASLERGRNGFWGEDKCQGHDSNLERPFKVETRGLRGHQALGGGAGSAVALIPHLAVCCHVVSGGSSRRDQVSRLKYWGPEEAAQW